MHRQGGNRLLLTLTQIGADLQKVVFFWQRTERIQRQQDINCEFARAWSQFQYITTGLDQYLGDALREALTEQRRDFWCGDKIAVRAELARACGVITQAGCVERQFHKARE